MKSRLSPGALYAFYGPRKIRFTSRDKPVISPKMDTVPSV
jgi:hypothetical protein